MKEKVFDDEVSLESFLNKAHYDNKIQSNLVKIYICM